MIFRGWLLGILRKVDYLCNTRDKPKTKTSIVGVMAGFSFRSDVYGRPRAIAETENLAVDRAKPCIAR
eukprot:scaffold5591_cov148-Skeletonema_marinoi.AAC.3